jgi:triosephosphate isomerase (TIM)
MIKKSEKIVIANFKMYLSSQVEVERWFSIFLKAKKDCGFVGSKIVLCPPEIFLEKFKSGIKSKKIVFGLQNCFWQNKGAFTGEIGPLMAKSEGADYVILGHSERRFFLGETDAMVARKIETAIAANLQPILCVGENEQQKKSDLMMEVVLGQLEKCLENVSKGKIEKVVICYEPVWAISANGPQRMPTTNEIMGARLLIKKFLVEKYGRNVSERIRIIYGGSVDDKNIKAVCLDTQMDGVLVGGASQRPYELVKICQVIDNNIKN